MLSEFLIEVKLFEEQDKIAQIVTGANGAQLKPASCPESSSRTGGMALSRSANFCGRMNTGRKKHINLLWPKTAGLGSQDRPGRVYVGDFSVFFPRHRSHNGVSGWWPKS